MIVNDSDSDSDSENLSDSDSENLSDYINNYLNTSSYSVKNLIINNFPKINQFNSIIKKINIIII